MFDLGFTELLVIGVVALIVVGPKDLPGLFRNVGKFIGKAKGMAREFSSAMNDAADESGFKDATSGFNDLKKMANPMKAGMESISDTVKEATNEFTKWSPNATTGSETSKLAKDRADAAKKIHAATANKAIERKASEAAKAVAEATKVAKGPAKSTAKATSKAGVKAGVKAKATAKAAVKAKAPAKTKVAPKAKPRAKAAAKPRTSKPKAATTKAAAAKTAKVKTTRAKSANTTKAAKSTKE